MHDVGARIRALRTKRGLTLREASKRCDIPASTLSNIESKDHAISLTNLLRIAQAFGVSPTTFLAEEEAPTSDRLTPAAREVVRRGPFRAEMLTGRADASGLQMYLLTCKKGLVEPWANPHAGWEYLFVLDGELDVLIEDEPPARLVRNDFFYFRSDRPHTLNIHRTCRLIVIGFGPDVLPGTPKS